MRDRADRAERDRLAIRRQIAVEEDRTVVCNERDVPASRIQRVARRNGQRVAARNGDLLIAARGDVAADAQRAGIHVKRRQRRAATHRGAERRRAVCCIDGQCLSAVDRRAEVDAAGCACQRVSRRECYGTGVGLIAGGGDRAGVERRRARDREAGGCVDAADRTVEHRVAGDVDRSRDNRVDRIVEGDSRTRQIQCMVREDVDCDRCIIHLRTDRRDRFVTARDRGVQRFELGGIDREAGQGRVATDRVVKGDQTGGTRRVQRQCVAAIDRRIEVQVAIGDGQRAVGREPDGPLIVLFVRCSDLVRVDVRCTADRKIVQRRDLADFAVEYHVADEVADEEIVRAVERRAEGDG